jgi:hypothetical protein
MLAQAKTGEARLIYDPSRGGFCLEFCHPRPAPPHFNLFGGIMGANITDDRRVTCVDSAWDRGGLLLNTLYHKRNEPRSWNLHRKPEFDLADGLTQADPFVVIQTPDDFQIWFGSAPSSEPPAHHDSATMISVWMAPGRVRHPYLDTNYGTFEKPVVIGIRVGFRALAGTYPMKSLSIRVEDFK